MRITEQEQVIRKNHIIHVAYELFCQDGIDGVSVAQISKAAGVSASTIFRYFDGKAALVQCTQSILWEEIVAHILAGSEEQLAQAKDGFEEIKIILSNFQRLYENHSKFLLFASDYKLFLMRNHIKLSVLSHNKIMAPIFNTFISALKRGQTDGSISKHYSVAEEFSVMWGIMRGFVEEIAIYDQIYEGSNPFKDRFNLVLFYILEGLKTKH